MEKPLIIANYLPQFHPTVENDKWWGTGFTEWTNVAKAKPLFKQHYQPKIPADLGFYDLRYSEYRERQADLARQAGISAFCYWHYWLGSGRRLLEVPFNEVLKLGKPNFPFCLGWANHDWQRKDWSSDASVFVKETLIKQEYNGKEDVISHFYDMLPAFQDPRYFKINGRLVFKIFKPDEVPNIQDFFEMWNSLALQNGIPEFYFVACTVNKEDVYRLKKMGFDLVNLSMLNYPFKIKYTKLNIVKRLIKSKLLNITNKVEYSEAIKYFNPKENGIEYVAPTIIPNWDHTPRSGNFGTVLHNSTPELFRKHVNQIFSTVKEKDNKVIFLKSWNEWGEGNYIEPDLKFGKKYIDTLSNCLHSF